MMTSKAARFYRLADAKEFAEEKLFSKLQHSDLYRREDVRDLEIEG